MTPEEFCTELYQRVETEASLDGDERSLPGTFTRLLLDQLSDMGETDDAFLAYYEARGMRVSAYSVGGDDEYLDLFVTHYTGLCPPGVMSRADVEAHFRRLSTFVGKCRDGLHTTLEESSAAYDMAERVQSVLKEIDRIRLFLLTDSVVRSGPPEPAEMSGVPVTCHVWDFDRLYKLSTSGQQREPITVDVSELNGCALPCLGPVSTGGGYDAYLLAIPGKTLAEIYGRFGARLLELNVRSFLQARGKVNRGIQDTLRSEPERFLAYNNGISMTASGVDVLDQAGGSSGITTIRDLQIVNGGQTTASLYYASVKSKVNLDNVRIQAKLSVVDGPLLDEIVPRISEYANSQNKVNTADFSANDPFHVAVEKLSRTVWAPPHEGTSALTRWFYERARGQYADELARERTPARQRKFREIHPLGQKFTKTDMAKYENSWDQLPQIVSLGAEKNFREFMLRLKARGHFDPDQRYFERLVAKAILFRRSEKIIGALNLGGYRAQTVTYTLALIAHGTGQRLDLDAIWRSQELSPVLRATIAELAPEVHSRILDAPGRGNVGEWCKKPKCWEMVRAVDWSPIEDLGGELLPIGRGTSTKNETSIAEALSEEEQKDMEAVAAVPSDVWFELAAWAKQTGNLLPWQRGLVFSLGKLAAQARAPSRKQAVQGARIHEEALRLGFRASSGQSD